MNNLIEGIVYCDCGGLFYFLRTSTKTEQGEVRRPDSPFLLR